MGGAAPELNTGDPPRSPDDSLRGSCASIPAPAAEFAVVETERVPGRRRDGLGTMRRVCRPRARVSGRRAPARRPHPDVVCHAATTEKADRPSPRRFPTGVRQPGGRLYVRSKGPSGNGPTRVRRRKAGSDRSQPPHHPSSFTAPLIPLFPRRGRTRTLDGRAGSADRPHVPGEGAPMSNDRGPRAGAVLLPTGRLSVSPSSPRCYPERVTKRG